MINTKNVIALLPRPEAKVLFELSKYLNVPQSVGCYLLTNTNGDILYIGQTTDLGRRFQEHLDDPQKTQLTSDGRAVWFFYLQCNESNLDQVENSWLNDYETKNGRLPILNKKRAPCS